jgi:hypothetical protein
MYNNNPIQHENVLFEHERAVMGLFIDNAKTYMQLSTGLLAFSVTFSEKALGDLRWFTVSSWVLLLIAVGSGAVYQYLAVHFVQSKSTLIKRSHEGIMPKWLVQHPWPLYGVMLFSFFIGAILFIGGAAYSSGGVDLGSCASRAARCAAQAGGRRSRGDAIAPSSRCSSTMDCGARSCAR